MSAANSPQTTLISIDELDHAIVSCAARINAATYELLLLLRQFDERAGFLRWGLGNSAEWLAWRCDLSLVTAKEKLRVAHALKTLPSISASFSSGELSYSKVRELTRVADRNNEQDLLVFALRVTATHVAQRCRELRMGEETSLDNLMQLCTKHHTLVHEGGFRIETDFQDDWSFVRPDGIAVPEIGYHSRDMVDEDHSRRAGLYG